MQHVDDVRRLLNFPIAWEREVGVRGWGGGSEHTRADTCLGAWQKIDASFKRLFKNVFCSLWEFG